jgi:acetyl esterase/lipase
MILLLLSVQASANPSNKNNKSFIDNDGTVNLPKMRVPYSDFASPAAKRDFIEQARLLESLTKEYDPAKVSIQQLRHDVDDLQLPALNRLRASFPVIIVPATIGDVHTAVIMPRGGIGIANKNRVLINLHGGGMIVGARYGGEMEAVPIASLAGIKVVTVDYRMAPEAHFPAASEDVANVYRELLKSYRPENIGIYGCSSGAALTAQAVVWFKAHKLPRPGAIGLFGEGALDDSRPGEGDSGYVSAALSGLPVAVSPSKAEVSDDDYTGHADRNDPTVSPANHIDTLKDFPPVLLVSGTRDPGLSTVLYTHAQLVDAGVDADLHVWEGAYHCFVAGGDPAVPEKRQAWQVITRFFDKHLGRRPL